MALGNESYLRLQNGSDIRGVALENSAGEAVNLNAQIAMNIAAAFVDYLAEKKGVDYSSLRIGIGHDSRLSAQDLKNGIVSGILLRGATPLDCGLASTPAMFMSTVLPEFAFDGGIMITASHLPMQRNGFKFFTSEGGLESKDIKEILETASLISWLEHRVEVRPMGIEPLMRGYGEHLKEIIRREVGGEKPLSDLHIVVDASNGVGGYFTGVLEDLGASTEGSICLEPDGTFPNHVPNPENGKAMEMVKKAVLDAKADLGVIFDTDGDRAAVVFSNGEEVNKDTIIALLAAILAKDHPGTTVVTDSVTSHFLTDFLENHLGMKHHRFKRGYKNVINEAIRLNREGEETHLAMETSGHGALKENYFLDDGAYLSVKIICSLAKCRREGASLEDYIKDLKKAEESRELRIHINEADYKSYGEKVLKEFAEYVDAQERFHLVSPNYEGIRVNFDDEEVKGWMLLRMSLHDPILPLNIEAERAGGVEIILNRLRPFLEKYRGLDGI